MFQKTNQKHQCDILNVIGIVLFAVASQKHKSTKVQKYKSTKVQKYKKHKSTKAHRPQQAHKHISTTLTKLNKVGRPMLPLQSHPCHDTVRNQE
jgi:hypothetical protein